MTDAKQAFTATPAGICEAARVGDVAAIDVILADKPALITIDNPHNWTKTVDGHAVRGSYNKKPIVVAAFFNQPAAVATLLRISRNSPFIKSPIGGYFDSLSIARTLKRQDVIKVIEADVFARIDARPDLVNFADDKGYTLLQYAAQQGHMPLVRSLIERGANADPSQNSGYRVIHAVLDGPINDERREIAKLLIKNGADYDLWVATALDDVGRVKELLAADSSSANRHYRPDCDGLSEGFPLVRACARGNREIVELLLEHGADINAELPGNGPAEFGMPIIAAVYAGHYDIAHLLLDRGASIEAYPNCAAPFVDMLYYASVEESPQWLALGELPHVTENRRSHIQPTSAGEAEVVKLYERVLSLGGEPQMYAHVKMRNHALIEKLLKEKPEKIASNPGGDDAVFNCLSHAAAWLGDANTLELCLSIHPELHSAEHANQHLNAAIRSHNRDGNFLEYRRIIEMNLRYLDGQDSPITVQPLWLLADDFLENYSYGTCPNMPAISDLLNLAELFIEHGANVNERHPESNQNALSQAVNEGHTEYVEFLLKHGALVCNDDPPETNPVAIAKKHGFKTILSRLEDATRRDEDG